MSKSVAIWKSPRLRATWLSAVSPKFVAFLEKLARSGVGGVERSPSEHQRETKIPMKYIRRFFDELECLGLADVTRGTQGVSARLRLPVSIEPPAGVSWPIWASELKPHPNLSGTVRREVYERDRGVCAYCGDPVPFDRAEIDHIYPVKMRGGHDEDNLAVACKPCNRRKWLYPPGHTRCPTLKWFHGRRVVGAPEIIEKEGRLYLCVATA